jgi:hypothetical protein
LYPLYNKAAMSERKFSVDKIRQEDPARTGSAPETEE